MDEDELKTATQKQELVHNYVEEYLEMLNLFDTVVVDLYQLIESSSVNDVTASIDALVSLNIRSFLGVDGLINRILRSP
jgi:hypothetical protein